MPTPRIPKLCRHKASSRGVVRLDGVDHYLGHWPEKAKKPPRDVQAAYDAKVAEWLAGNRQQLPAKRERLPESPPAFTVGALADAWWEAHSQPGRYKGTAKRGELANYTHALKPLRDLFAALPVEQFGPLALKRVRAVMVEAGLARSLINSRVQRIIRVFKWGVSEERVPEATWRALTAVPGLRAGQQAGLRESEPVLPVSEADYAAALPSLPPHASGAVRFMRHTGCRPDEACRLTLAMVDRSGPVWLYNLKDHKTAHKGRRRAVPLGPRARAVVQAFIRIRCPLCQVEGLPRRIGSRDGILCGLCADRAQREGLAGPWVREEVQPADQPLFSPRVQREEIDEEKRRCRRSKVQPSQRCRKKVDTRRKPGESYTAQSLGVTVARACKAAGIAPWHPNQLRHLRATEIRQSHGLEAAQAVLGHARADVTLIYAERDLALAAKVAGETG